MVQMAQRSCRLRIIRVVFFISGLALGQIFVNPKWPIQEPERRHLASVTRNSTEKDQTNPVSWHWDQISSAPPIPKVYVVTPTYRRPSQLAELTRIAQAIIPAKHFVEWIIVDELEKSSPEHVEFLEGFMHEFNISGLVINSLNRSKEQKRFEQSKNRRVSFRAKGVTARRAAIRLIRKRKLKGVVYFADDDNTYDSDIFRQMQGTKKVSMWPVGCITQLAISAPILKEGKVVRFYDGFIAHRKFPVDFAEFAINIDLLHQNPGANVPYITSYEETYLLSTLQVELEDIEALGGDSTEIMAWHTKTVPISSRHVNQFVLPRALAESNIADLFKRYDFL